MLVGISLVYLLMVILVRSLLVFLVILCALPLAVVGAFVAVAVTSRALDLSALIGLLMLGGIVVTNAIVLLDLAQHKIEAGGDVRTALMQGGRIRVRLIPMTAAAAIQALIPPAPSSGGIRTRGDNRDGQWGTTTVGCYGTRHCARSTATVATFVGGPHGILQARIPTVERRKDTDGNQCTQSTARHGQDRDPRDGHGRGGGGHWRRGDRRGH